MVVVDFPTIMDGYVVRWYATEDAANHHEPIISASRNGVTKHVPGPVADELERVAMDVHDAIRQWYDAGARTRREEPKPWAHHLTHVVHMFRDVEPITAGGA